MGPFGIFDDEHVTKELLCRAEENDKIYLASGYFNLTEDYMAEILNESKAQYEILTAAPQVCLKFTIYLSHLMIKPTMWFPNRSDTNQTVQSQKLKISDLRRR